MQKLKFSKMHGLGNDFMVVNCLEQQYDLKKIAMDYSHRRFGIGFDQLLAILPSEKADYKMLIFNADGSEVEMCGNGIRCFASYLREQKISDQDSFEIETLGGLIKPKFVGDLIAVDMGEPILDPSQIPVNAESMLIEKEMQFGVEPAVEIAKITCVSMGNPHAVLFVDNIAQAPVINLGQKIETDPVFPKRINVEFVQVVSPNHLQMRVWERGAGETYACGTGACAALVAAVLAGHAEREATVTLKGGDLKIFWDEKDNHVWMTGPSSTVYHGEIHV